MKLPLAIIIILVFQSAVFSQSRQDNSDSVRIRLLLKASHADSARKDYSSAVRHFYQYRRLSDSLLEIAKKKQMIEMESRYQTIKKDNEIVSREKNIKLLTGQNRLIDNNLQQTRLIRNIIIGVLIVAALLLALSYLQYRLKKNANLRLETQQNLINQKNEVLQNLSEEKDQLLDEKELLIKEIHHRVKNNLQVVISLLNTQSVYLNDPGATAAIRQSQHRMQSISLIHQKLYQSESRALINIKDYAAELVQYLRQSFDTGSRIIFQLNIDDIELDVVRAVPLGLILNEAITNAIKYAFAPGDGGLIEVELKCIDGNHLKLMVADNGSGMPPEFDINICQSLGFNLIKGMCRQINGRLHLQNKKGVLIAIAFPAEAPDGQLNDDISPFDHSEIAR